MKKVEILVSSCIICPKFDKYGRISRHHKGSNHICRETGRIILDERKIQDWCPLEDYDKV